MSDDALQPYLPKSDSTLASVKLLNDVNYIFYYHITGRLAYLTGVNGAVHVERMVLPLVQPSGIYPLASIVRGATEVCIPSGRVIIG